MLKKAIFLLFLFFSLTSRLVFLWAQNPSPNILKNYAMMYDLTKDWQVYDQKYGGYVPYIMERHQKPKSVSCWLDLEKYRRFQLVLWANANTFLFINNQLCRNIEKDAWLSISLDSLYRVFPQKQVFLSIYDNKQRLPLSTIAIVQKMSTPEVFNKQNLNPSKSLERNPRLPDYKDFVIIAALGLLAFFTFLWNFNPKTFINFYYPSLSTLIGSLTRRELNITALNRPFSGVNIWFMIGQALLLGYYYITSSLIASPNLNFQWIILSYDSINLIINWLLIAAAFLALTFGKYLLVTISAILLNIKKEVAGGHFYEYIRLNMIFYLIISIIICYIYTSQFYMSITFIKIMRVFIPGFHIIQAILVSFYVNRQLEYRSLYLFYYLCIVELIPLLIGIKLLI
jgi:hypothetical protein